MVAQPKGWRLLLQYGMPVLFIAALMTWLFLLLGNPDITNLAALLRPALFVILLGLIAATLWVKQIMVTNRIWKDKRIRRQVTGFINDHGIAFASSGSAHLVPWQDYARLFSSRYLYVALGKDASLTILPATFFESPMIWEKAQNLIKKHLAYTKNK